MAVIVLITEFVVDDSGLHPYALLLAVGYSLKPGQSLFFFHGEPSFSYEF
jgi:hypothetical protein